MLIVVGIGVLMAVTARRPDVQRRSLMTTAIRVGGMIAAIRLGLFWSSLALYSGHADWRQVLGYGLLIGNALVELGIAASLAAGPGSPFLVSALIVLTSGALGGIWGWIRSPPASGPRGVA